MNFTLSIKNDDGTLNMVYYLQWEVLEEGDGGVNCHRWPGPIDDIIIRN